MKWLVNKAVKQYLALRMKRIERYMQRPEEAQERWLRSMLDTARNTEFGRQYNFGALKNAEDFARTVPVQDYDSLKGSIARMMRGERDVLWPGEINWYSKSSGTTSDKSKFIRSLIQICTVVTSLAAGIRWPCSTTTGPIWRFFGEKTS